ncbi:MAG: serine proteinase [Oscillospiraceae bacterium]|nr:serine proteinase [Oscillospiraceae bacterium]
MALFDFDALKDRARDLAQTGVSKSKQIGEIAKLNLANVGEEENIRKAYIEIGKLYYAERGMAPEPAYAALCEKITASKVTIEENKNRVEELKAEGGVQDSEVEFPVEPLAETPAKEAPVAPEENKDVPPAE